MEIVEWSDTPNLSRVYRDSLEIGAIEIAEHRKVLAVALPWRWNISLGDRTFGTVERSMVVNADSLCIDRLGGDALPLRVARVDSLVNAIDILLRLFTPAGFLLPTPTNGDLVLRRHDAQLDLMQAWLYFATAVYFRMLAFDLDFS
ncbi:hypothetical protein Pla123a_18520 [Posidoniimonas polymericola]|uniref:Uncharacterized protein n=1 Tax=Posidoniimonas polymericola TaxID=2528002 RepID=A0A5C5YR29_9BACT|nr:hypothetical protein Pla123a_18520 [Posidoniimonas polymericola]